MIPTDYRMSELLAAAIITLWSCFISAFPVAIHDHMASFFLFNGFRNINNKLRYELQCFYDEKVYDSPIPFIYRAKLPQPNPSRPLLPSIPYILCPRNSQRLPPFLHIFSE